MIRPDDDDMLAFGGNATIIGWNEGPYNEPAGTPAFCLGYDYRNRPVAAHLRTIDVCVRPSAWNSFTAEHRLTMGAVAVYFERIALCVSVDRDPDGVARSV